MAVLPAVIARNMYSVSDLRKSNRLIGRKMLPSFGAACERERERERKFTGLLFAVLFYTFLSLPIDIAPSFQKTDLTAVFYKVAILF